MYPANTEVLKEPRGFIKFLEIVIAIFAFATTTSHHSESVLTVTCPDGVTLDPIKLPFQYPYRLENNNAKFAVPLCNSTWSHHNDTRQGDVKLYGNFSSSAEFYVFVGVMAFLYSLAALLVYVFADEQYQHNDKVPIVDFITTIVFVVLWLISSSAWADALTKIKHYTDPEDLWHGTGGQQMFPECHDESYAEVKCVGSQGTFASLNVSIIFGFLNMCIWAGNLWFLYKETKWFKPAPGLSPDHSSPETPQRM